MYNKYTLPNEYRSFSTLYSDPFKIFPSEKSLTNVLSSLRNKEFRL